MSLFRWPTLESLGLRRSEPPITKFTAIFPPEIWVIIIECVLESLKAPDTYCKSVKLAPFRTPLTFGRYKAPHNYIGGIGDNSDWASVRLVCRAWAELAGPRRQLYVRGPNYRLHPRLTGVKFGYSADEVLFRQLASTPDISRRLTSLYLTEGYEEEYTGGTMELLLNHSSDLRLLRSLILEMDSHGERTLNLWGRLMEGFPLLIHLAVFNSFLPSEKIFFGGLESLMISTSPSFQSASGKFILPSLRNLAIAGWRPEFEQLLQDHGHQLASLKLSTQSSQPLAFGDRFWTYVPNLRVLDLCHFDIEGLGSIPAGHPLQRLCVHALQNNEHQTERVRQILDQFPGVSHLCLSGIILYSWRRKAICRLANQRGVEFSAFAKPDPLDGLPWYKYLFHRFYHIRRTRDMLFFPFGAVLALVGGIIYLFCWVVGLGFVWMFGYVRRGAARLKSKSD